MPLLINSRAFLVVGFSINFIFELLLSKLIYPYSGDGYSGFIPKSFRLSPFSFKDLLQDSIKILNDREKEILYSRRLTDEPRTLEDLSKKFKISRERIRQIENKAFEKLQKHMLNSAKSKNHLPAN